VAQVLCERSRPAQLSCRESLGDRTKPPKAEFHHLVPFAVGGATTIENLQLRCRSHNAHEADVFFETLSGQSSGMAVTPARDT